MQIVERVLVKACPEIIWQLLADVERWPAWTPTVLHVQPLTSGGLQLGARYRVTQPKLRPGIYEVTECAPHQAFTWVQKVPGATMIADHRLSGDSSETEVELSFATEGMLGSILGSFYAKRIADYVRIEARSLKARCESMAVSPIPLAT